MFEGQRVLAVIPARGGSKGLPGKNLRTMNGVSLVAHAAGIATGLAYIDRAVVSTDDSEIADAAKRAGLTFNGFRPAELAGDRVADWPVLHHELLAAEHADATQYDLVIMLQPTCPLRRPTHVTQAIQTLVSESFDSVWTVSLSDPKFHPLKQLTVDATGRLDYHDKAGAGIIARQQLSPLYHRNGAAYVMTRECVIGQHAVLGVRAGAVVIDEPLISIDTQLDLHLCEFLSAQTNAE